MATQEQNKGPADLDVYLSPYEYWNFGKGRGYAFPGVRKHTKYISAFAELVPKDPSDRFSAMEQPGLLPTLWREYRKPRFLPFIAENLTGHAIVDVEVLKQLLLGGLKHVVDIFTQTQIGVSAKFLSIKEGRFRVALPMPDGAVHEKMPHPTDPKPEPDAQLRTRVNGKRLTIMAVIDDGIPFAHRNFRDADGCRTRVEFCWLQSATIDPKQNSVLFGREYMRADIDELIERSGGDEDRLYHEAGATTDADDFGSLLDHHTTHGAHVMNLATGYDPARGEEPPEDIRIIAVQLPNSVTMDTSGFGEDMYVLSAFHYIFNRADIIRDMYGVSDPRLVINFSYGCTGGRHDGETEVEAAINELIQMRRKSAPTALVLAAGNTFLDRLHAEIHDADFDRDDVVELPWRIQPNDRTPSYLELWFWQPFDPSGPFGFSVELRNPSGAIVDFRNELSGQHQTSLPVKADYPNGQRGGDPRRVLTVLNPLGEVIGQISADSDRADGPGNRPEADDEAGQQTTGRWRVLIVIAPTEPENDCLPGADSGKWTVTIVRGHQVRVDDYPIHCWIQRATDFESFRSGSRQSYFDEDAYEDTRFTPQGDLAEKDPDEKHTKKPFVKRFGSLNGLATGRSSLVVGGYRLGAGLGSSLACAQPALYSAAGVRNSNWPDKQVDCSSMSDRSRALPGTLSAGVRSGSRSFVQGTSAAAPFVARQLAETFVTEEESVVQGHQAKESNYLSLLRGYEPETEKQASPPDGNDPRCCKDDPELIKARLGAVLVPPYWQPGIERRACDEEGASENSAAVHLR
jgi:hypothetical protein